MVAAGQELRPRCGLVRASSGECLAACPPLPGLRVCAWAREADKWPGLSNQRRSKQGCKEWCRQLKGLLGLPECDTGLSPTL